MEKTQIGVMALRDSNGKFLSSKPIYRNAVNKTNLDDELAKVFLSKYEEYQQALATSQHKNNTDV